MIIAITATVMSAQVTAYSILIVTMLSAAVGGTLVAKKVQMTEMPELVAILHSFVGMAAVLIGFASFLEGTDYTGAEKVIHDVEIYLGVLIGAVTFRLSLRGGIYYIISSDDYHYICVSKFLINLIHL